jgi:hypothetical protein
MARKRRHGDLRQKIRAGCPGEPEQIRFLFAYKILLLRQKVVKKDSLKEFLTKGAKFAKIKSKNTTALLPRCS